MSVRPEVIDLGSSSDDSARSPGSFLARSLEDRDEISPVRFGNSLGSHENDRIGRCRRTFNTCLKEILEVFPDISHEHVQELHSRALSENPSEDGIARNLIEQILDGGNYPKERERLRELNALKRKREDRNSDDEEAARWKYVDQRTDPLEYAKIAKLALQEAFPFVPVKYLDEQFKEHGHFYGAYFEIAKVGRQYDEIQPSRYTKLKSRRHHPNPFLKAEDLMAALQRQGLDFDGLKQEMDAARRRRKKEDLKFQEKIQAAKELELRDQQHREKGEIIECACCFDEATIANITHCNGDLPHMFCHDCARRNASNDIGNNKYELQCMDGSGCKATFSREQRLRFLDQQTIEKLEQLQQRGELLLANLQNFVTCPFCEYGHICPPIQEDREFRCENKECEEISCRLCQQRSHIPLSCQENRKENGMSERRVIEEARSEALIRTCQKCKLRIMKTDGCNKVVCTGCYSVICDYCGKDITKLKYGHFDGQWQNLPALEPRMGKCPLYDESENRKDVQIEDAGRAAMEQVRKDNPGLSEQDLRIRFSKEVEAKKHGPGRHPLPDHIRRQMIHQIPPGVGAGQHYGHFAELPHLNRPLYAYEPFAADHDPHEERRRQNIQRIHPELRQQLQIQQQMMRQRAHEHHAHMRHLRFGGDGAVPALDPHIRPLPGAQPNGGPRPTQNPILGYRPPIPDPWPGHPALAQPHNETRIFGGGPLSALPNGDPQQPTLVPGRPNPPIDLPMRADPQLWFRLQQRREALQQRDRDGQAAAHNNVWQRPGDEALGQRDLDFNVILDEEILHDDPFF